MGKPLTKETFARIHDLQTRRREIQSQANQLESEEKRLLSEVQAALEESGKTTAKRGDYRAVIEEKSGRLSYKDELANRLEPGELERLQAAVSTTRKLKIVAASLLMCLMLTGCLKHSPEAPAVYDPDPFIEEAADEPGFTGAVIYTKADCRPCRLLIDDIKHVCSKRPEWSFCYDDGGPAVPERDWVIARAAPEDPAPFIEYWNEGEIIDTVVGYTSKAKFAQRKPVLSDLFRRHPRSNTRTR